MNPTVNPELKRGVAAIRRNAQLCYLQLCLTVPLMFYNALYFVVRWWDDADIERRKRQGDFSWAYQKLWIWLLLYSSQALAHCFHFYYYVLFCKSFRDGFSKRVRHVILWCRIV